MLTLDRQLQAKEEGWKVIGGYVSRAYNAKGESPFNSVYEVIAFIIEKGRTSEWHREFYLNLPWNGADDTVSFAEGWRLAYAAIIPRSSVRFPTDEALKEFFDRKISEGHPLYIKAMTTMVKRRLLYGV